MEKVKLVSRHKPGKNMHISRQTPGEKNRDVIMCGWLANEFEQALRTETKECVNSL